MGVATPDHVLYVTPRTFCPATEPAVPPPGPDPDPPLNTDDCDGECVRVSVVDTGWWLPAETAHSWLAGVTGDPEDPFDASGQIRPYGGHGTFAAGVLRSVAPRSTVRVEGILPAAGAWFESDIVRQLYDAVAWAPDVISLQAGTTTRRHAPLLAFQVLYETRLVHMPGTVRGRQLQHERAVLAGGVRVGRCRRGAQPDLHREGQLEQLRPVGRRLRPRRGHGQCLRGRYLRHPGAADAGRRGPRLHRHGSVERDVVLDALGRGRDRRAGVEDLRERPGRGRRGTVPGPPARAALCRSGGAAVDGLPGSGRRARRRLLHRLLAAPAAMTATMVAMTPAELVTAAASGESAAWDALVNRYTGLLWSVARGFRLDQADAADAVQTAWLRLVEHLDRLHDPEHVGAWLATTVRRECLRQLRRSGRERATENADLDVVDLAAAPLELKLLQEEAAAELNAALDRLTGTCRQLLRVLMTDPPPSYDEVSAAMDMPVGSIGPTRGRCLDRLRREMSRSRISRASSDSSTRGGDGRRR
jgi:RNA polymerase sigma factor (sigma-70 family)